MNGKEYLTENEFHVLGVQRTGQHAIIGWLIGHFDKVCFRNGLSAFCNERHPGICPPYWYFNLNERNFQWRESQGKRIKGYQDAIILGTEFVNPMLTMHRRFEEDKARLAKDAGFDNFSKNNTNIIVIRSPWNHLASVLSWKNKWYLKKKERFIDCWLMMARECLGITNNIHSPKLFIIFDKWFSDKNYRMELAKKLKIKFSDRGLNIVMPVGRARRGSSFNTMEYNGDAQKMKVLDRWKSYLSNSVEFTNVIYMRKELLDLSEKIFGPIPFDKEGKIK